MPVRIAPSVLDDIDRRAAVLGRSRAAVIRSLLSAALGHDEDVDDGVDRAQIRRMLALSPAERLRHMNQVGAQQRRLRAKAVRSPR